MGDELKTTITTWVEELLSDEFNKIHVEFPEYDASGGYGSEMVIVNVTGERNEAEENLSLILKRSLDGILLQDNLNFKVFYENEYNIYSKIVPYLRKFAIQRSSKPFENIPFCYGTIRRNNRYVIAMENLKPKGYKLNDIGKPFDLLHTKLVLEAYAEWHALSFALRDQERTIFEEFAKCNCSKNTTEAKGYQYFIATIENEILFLVDIYRTRGLHQVVDKLDLLKKNFRNMIIGFMASEDDD